MEGNKLRVLIIAHELSPIKGSESAVGWNIVTRLSKYHDVTVLYASGSQFRNTSFVDVINNYFLNSPHIPGLTLINLDKPRMQKIIAFINILFKKVSPIGLPLLFYLGYNYWQKAVYKEAKRLHKLSNFDIVHQLTLISFREPGYLWKMGIPFFWGPTGGTSSFPNEFLKLISLQSRILARIRSFSNYYQFNFSQRIIKANRKASMIYAFSENDFFRLKNRSTGQVKIMLDVGTYNRLENSAANNNDQSILKGLWCGRLDEYKAPEIILKVLSLIQMNDDGLILQIIGRGPLEKSLKEVADELNLRNVEWLSEVSHEEIFKLMAQADFLVHTSIREATSSVIPEALSVGLPVICHDAYGMGIAINESCGIKIPLKSPEESISGFYEAIKSLLLDRYLLEKLKVGAKRRSIEISWDVMAETIAKDYISLAKTSN